MTSLKGQKKMPYFRQQRTEKSTSTYHFWTHHLATNNERRSRNMYTHFLVIFYILAMQFILVSGQNSTVNN